VKYANAATRWFLAVLQVDEQNRPMVEPAPARRRFGGAVAIGAGILLSRIAGLVRERVLAHYLGLSVAADAFRAALRIPNFLQNLLGEGVLSASFIPVYSRLLAEGREDDARRVARAVGTLLALVAAVACLLGVLAARPLISGLAPGFGDEARELTVTLVRIMFPGATLLVLSGWCLGVLNSHRRFFLSYVSPVLWNAAVIVAAVLAGTQTDDSVAIWVAWGAVAGSAAQFLVQLPTVIALLRSVRPSLAVRDPGVQQTFRAFVPVLLGRGSVQVSAFIDQIIASFVGRGIVAAIANAQVLTLLPVSLFGMAISAAELPEMASATGSADARAEHVQQRLGSALRRVTFFVVPSAVAFVAIGGSIVALIFQTGRFSANDTEVVWLVLAGSSLGLVPSTQSRLLGSAFYALGDPRPPFHASLVRVVLSVSLGFSFALPLREVFGYGPAWGAFALTAASAAASWVENGLLRMWLARRIGSVPVPTRFMVGATAAALLAGAAGYAASYAVGDRLGAYAAVVTVPVFGIVYLGAMVLARVPETRALGRLLGR
jgi:putative peptidoglycan lipid II flippase